MAEGARRIDLAATAVGGGLREVCLVSTVWRQPAGTGHGDDGAAPGGER